MFNFDQVLKLAATGLSVVKKHRIAIYRTIEVTALVGAAVYGAKTARRTLCKIEDEQYKKEEALTGFEKAAIVAKDQGVTIALGATALAARIGIEVATGKHLYSLKLANHNLQESNKSLVDQLAEAAVMYNTVNTVKDAMQKKVEDKKGQKDVEEVQRSVAKELYKQVSPLSGETDNTIKVYSFSERKINEANDKYLQTGNAEYKPQVFWFPWLGQKFISYNKLVDEGIENFKEKIRETGFGTMNEFVGMIGACESDSGDYQIYRLEGPYFDAHVYSDDYDGEAVRVISLMNLPMFDRNGRYE